MDELSKMMDQLDTVGADFGGESLSFDDSLEREILALEKLNGPSPSGSFISPQNSSFSVVPVLSEDISSSVSEQQPEILPDEILPLQEKESGRALKRVLSQEILERGWDEREGEALKKVWEEDLTLDDFLPEDLNPPSEPLSKNAEIIQHVKESTNRESEVVMISDGEDEEEVEEERKEEIKEEEPPKDVEMTNPKESITEQQEDKELKSETPSSPQPRKNLQSILKKTPSKSPNRNVVFKPKCGVLERDGHFREVDMEDKVTRFLHPNPSHLLQSSLMKKGNSKSPFAAKWKKRWFILTPEGFKYFETIADRVRRDSQF